MTTGSPAHSPGRQLRERRGFAAVAATVMVLLAGGCTGGSVTASNTPPATAGPSGNASPTPAGPTAPGTSASHGFAAFVGKWYGHGSGLVILPGGHFTISARTYTWCSQSPPPCDTISGNTIVDGIHISGQLSSLSGDVATGQVTHTTDPADTPEGQIAMTFDPRSDIITVGSLSYCGPYAPAGACGA